MARQKEFEREEVLEKALEVFWCKGYNPTSFQTLTEGMCINRQSIYDTYGDKHTLYIEALNHYYGKTAAATSAHFAQNKSVKELLKTFIDQSICNASNEKKGRGCMMVNASSELMPQDKDVAEIVKRNFNHTTRVIQAVLERASEAGEIKKGTDLHVKAMFMVNTLQGLITMAKSFTDKKQLQAVADVAIEAVMG